MRSGRGLLIFICVLEFPSGVKVILNTWTLMRLFPGGAQRSSHKPKQMDRQTDSDAYEPTVQFAQVGSTR